VLFRSPQNPKTPILIVFVILNPIMDSFLKGKFASAKAKISSAAQFI